MIIALIIGFITGWLISMPIGPVNATAISRTLQFGFKFGATVGVGAAIMDFIYCAGAAQIHEFLSQSPIINLVFQSVGFLVLLWLGVKLFKIKETPAVEIDKKTHLKEENAEHRLERLHVNQSSLVGSFLIGVVLYASNVAGVPEWIFISGFWRENGVLGNGLGYNLMFATGAGLGTAGWFFTLVRYFSKRKSAFKPHTIFLINRFSSIAMLAFGVYFGYQIIFATKWALVHF